MKKDFDCVEMMHKAAEKIHHKLEGMTPDEKLEYYEKSYSELVQQQRKLQNKRKRLSKAA